MTAGNIPTFARAVVPKEMNGGRGAGKYGAPGSVVIRLEGGEDFFGVTFRFHLVEDVSDLAIRADDEGSTLNAQHLLAIHILFLHDAEGVGSFLILIGQQGIRQIVFFLKFLLPLRGVGGDAQDDRPGLLQLAVCVAEPARFNGSTRGVGLGIEEEDDGFAAQGFERHHVAVLVG